MKIQFLDGILQHYEVLRKEQEKINAINEKRIAELEKQIDAYNDSKCLIIKMKIGK